MSESTSPAKPLLSDNLYNVLKYVTTIVLPAVGALYFTLGQLWGFGSVNEVVGSIAALNTFAGALLHLSTSSYNKAQSGADDGSYADLIVSKSEGPMLSFNGHPDQLNTLRKVTLNVVHTDK